MSQVIVFVLAYCRTIYLHQNYASGEVFVMPFWEGFDCKLSAICNYFNLLWYMYGAYIDIPIRQKYYGYNVSVTVCLWILMWNYSVCAEIILPYFFETALLYLYQCLHLAVNEKIQFMDWQTSSSSCQQFSPKRDVHK